MFPDAYSLVSLAKEIYKTYYLNNKADQLCTVTSVNYFSLLSINSMFKANYNMR